MKAIVSFPKRTNWLKALGVLITCLLFLIPPSCEKPDPDQDSLPVTDEMVATPKAASAATKMYWGPSEWGAGSNWSQGMCTSWYNNFGNFVLKVQNVSDPGAKISTLEIKVSGMVILTAKTVSRDYFVTKGLRNFTQCADLHVFLEGTQGCRVRIWVEAVFKGLGTAYGKHLYYKAQQIQNLINSNEFPGDWNPFDMAREYCQQYGGHLLIINDAKENSFMKSICKNGQWLMGLTDFDQDQTWRWLNGSLNRTVDWRSSQCGNYDPGCPIPWGDPNCMLFTDFGYNNWGWGEPNNGGGGCDPNHRDEDVGVFYEDGTWGDRSLEDLPGINFVIEWDFIPNSETIKNLFMREYPQYRDWYPNWLYPW